MMKAVCWHGKFDVRVETVPEPRIINPRDAIIKVSLSAICGSDLHLYDDVIPGMKRGAVLGHEFMGRVVEVGSAVTNLTVGDRVVVPSVIACGRCFFCQRELSALCDNSNPNAAVAEKRLGGSGAGLFGYSDLQGGYAGGQAEYVRVPFADVGPLKVPDELDDEQVIFLSELLPTAYLAAENCQIHPGDIVAVWGCGPVGQLVIVCAFLLGAKQVIAIDGEPSRLRMAEKFGHATTLTSAPDVPDALRELTGGRGPDACVDAVGMEAYRRLHDTRYDQSKKDLDYSPKVPHVLQQAVRACRKGGTISVPGLYAGLLNRFPFGSAFVKNLTFRMGQTHVHRLMRPLLAKIQAAEIDPRFVITHRLGLDDASNGYALFNEREDGCVKVVLKP
jgi:threonine dehydrogenase-like Zn-dependent dehydrogenase